MTCSLHAYHCLAQPGEMLLACPVSPTLLKCPNPQKWGHGLQPSRRAALDPPRAGSSAGSNPGHGYTPDVEGRRVQLHVRQRAVSARKRLSGGCRASPWLPGGMRGDKSMVGLPVGSAPLCQPGSPHGETGCVGTDNAPSSQGCKPLRKVFSGRATIEKPSKENRSANKSHEKTTAVGTPSTDCATAGYGRQLSCCRAKQGTALSGGS